MAADGRGLQAQGEKRVEFFLQNGQPIEVAFKVTNVKKPISRVSGFHEHGVRRCSLHGYGSVRTLSGKVRGSPCRRRGTSSTSQYVFEEKE